MSTRFRELECAACDVIQIIKQIPELAHTRLSVIGGLALWHYLPNYRPTDNINFITNISTSPSWVKKRLLEWPNASFVLRSQILYYQSPSGREVQIDISPEWLSPYLPDSARNVRDIPYGEVPYISLTDLIVFKLDSSGLRSNLVKKERDARDAAALVEYEVGRRLSEARPPLQLSPKQEQVVEEALCDVAKCGAKEKVWWERHLGLSPAGSGLEYASLGGGRREDELEQRAAIRSRLLTDSDPGTAWWYYERLDRAHTCPDRVSRFGWLRRSNTVDSPATAVPVQDDPFSVRPGVARSASYNGYDQWRTREYHRLIQNQQQQQQQQQRQFRVSAATMTQPKTTNSSFYGYASSSSSPMSRVKRSSLAGSDSGYSSSDCDGHFYYLEPPGSTGGSSGGGDNDSDVYMSGWVFEDEREEGAGRKKGALRSGGMSKRTGRARGYSDLSSCGSAMGGGLETVPEHENEKAAVKRSVTFQL
ncbi:hypothetical protein F4809DRAFT_638409 [Biscogniauxia mediterranea]|nr:hypothetical protein F4809DRAFT_638409 [Biscogniauxia mediterranea]